MKSFGAVIARFPKLRWVTLAWIALLWVTAVAGPRATTDIRTAYLVLLTPFVIFTPLSIFGYLVEAWKRAKSVPNPRIYVPWMVLETIALTVFGLGLPCFYLSVVVSLVSRT